VSPPFVEGIISRLQWQIGDIPANFQNSIRCPGKAVAVIKTYNCNVLKSVPETLAAIAFQFKLALLWNILGKPVVSGTFDEKARN
jgi:hypothetical protein